MLSYTRELMMIVAVVARSCFSDAGMFHYRESSPESVGFFGGRESHHECPEGVRLIVPA